MLGLALNLPPSVIGSLLGKLSPQAYLRDRAIVEPMGKPLFVKMGPELHGSPYLDLQPCMSDHSINTYQQRIEEETQKKNILVHLPVTAKFTELVNSAKVRLPKQRINIFLLADYILVHERKNGYFDGVHKPYGEKAGRSDSRTRG